jgi:CheY-like chemotaxis protein
MNLEHDISTARILVVDDQAVNVMLLLRLLAEAGYSDVHSTQEPETVAALHAARPYDLILLDVQMPGLDGFGVMEALKRLKAQFLPEGEAPEDSGVLPVIVLTAHPVHKMRALLAGARDFISKPFDLLEVTTRIHHMLEVRLLYRRLARHNELLEATVRQRTEELRASEARYRALTELASDWYWEQDAQGKFVHQSGPVLELLGIADPLPVAPEISDADALAQGWDPRERRQLQELIAARVPFLDHGFHRLLPDGSRMQFRVSGQPVFDDTCRYLGYRGVGVAVTAWH